MTPRLLLQNHRWIKARTERGGEDPGAERCRKESIQGAKKGRWSKEGFQGAERWRKAGDQVENTSRTRKRGKEGRKKTRMNCTKRGETPPLLQMTRRKKGESEAGRGNGKKTNKNWTRRDVTPHLLLLHPDWRQVRTEDETPSGTYTKRRDTTPCLLRKTKSRQMEDETVTMRNCTKRGDMTRLHLHLLLLLLPLNQR